jgi:hypothetical protein
MDITSVFNRLTVDYWQRVFGSIPVPAGPPKYKFMHLLYTAISIIIRDNPDLPLKSLWIIYEVSTQFSENLVSPAVIASNTRYMAIFCRVIVSRFIAIPGYGPTIEHTYNFTRTQWSDMVVFLWVDSMHDMKAGLTGPAPNKRAKMATFSLRTFITGTLQINGVDYDNTIITSTFHFQTLMKLGVIEQSTNGSGVPIDDYIIQDLNLEKTQKFMGGRGMYQYLQVQLLLNRFGFTPDYIDRNGYSVGVGTNTKDVQKLNGSTIYLSLDQEYDRRVLSTLNMRNMLTVADFFDPGRYVKAVSGTAIDAFAGLLQDISRKNGNFNNVRATFTSAFVMNDFKINLVIEGRTGDPIEVLMSFNTPLAGPSFSKTTTTYKPAFLVQTKNWLSIGYVNSYNTTAKSAIMNARSRRGKLYGDWFQDLVTVGIIPLNYFHGSGDAPHVMSHLLLCQITNRVPRLAYDDSTSSTAYIFYPKTPTYNTANKFVVGTRNANQATATGQQRGVTNKAMTNLLRELRSKINKKTNYLDPSKRKAALSLINKLLNPLKATTTALKREQLKEFFKVRENNLNRILNNLGSVNSSGQNSLNTLIKQLRYNMALLNNNKRVPLTGPAPRRPRENDQVSRKYKEIVAYLRLTNKNNINNSKLRLYLENNTTGRARNAFLGLNIRNPSSASSVQKVLNIVRGGGNARGQTRNNQPANNRGRGRGNAAPSRRNRSRSRERKPKR